MSFDELIPKRWGILKTENGWVVDIMTKEVFRDKFDLSHDYAFYFDGIIIDEAHYVAGIKSKITKKMFKYIDRFKSDALSVYLLTATPYLSTPWNIYALGRMIGRLWNYIAFQKEMFYEISMGGRTGYKPRSSAPILLQKYKEQIGVTVKTEDVIADLPEQSITVRKVGMTEEQLEECKRDTTVDVLPRMTKLHQIENGYVPAVILEGKESRLLPNNKIPEVLTYAEQYPHSAFICRYTKQVEMVAEALATTGKKVYTLTGQTKDRDKVIEEARKGNCYVVIQGGVSEGYEFPEIEHVMFVSLDWSYKNYIQMMGRFLRINMPTPTEFIILVSGAIDTRVLQAINNKEDFYI